jgi:hypothetical protein
MSPLVSTPRPRERSHRPALRVMSRRNRADISEPMPADMGLNGVSGGTRAAAVLLAGSDARRRASLRLELGAKLGARTRFREAGEVAEVLERAPRSSIVILTGDLDDADGESLIRLLGRRHPQLPIVRVDEPAPAGAGECS